MKAEHIKYLSTIAQTIFDKKGFNILALDVRGISTLTDFFIIAEGNISRHLNSLSRAIKDKLLQNNISPLRVEGEKEGDWVVLDYGDVVIHLFVSEVREKYALEELWKQAKIVDLEINTSANKVEKHE